MNVGTKDLMLTNIEHVILPYLRLYVRTSSWDLSYDCYNTTRYIHKYRDWDSWNTFLAILSKVLVFFWMISPTFLQSQREILYNLLSCLLLICLLLTLCDGLSVYIGVLWWHVDVDVGIFFFYSSPFTDLMFFVLLLLTIFHL